MAYRIKAQDRLDPETLLNGAGEPVYAGDTHTMIVCRRMPNTALRVFALSVRNAFVPKVEVPVFGFDFAETDDALLPQIFDATFSRYPSVEHLVRSVSRHPWSYSHELESFDCFRNRNGVVLFRVGMPGDFVFSPFKRLPPWTEIPPLVTPELCARALLNGQYDAIRARAVTAGAPTSPWFEPDATDVARRIVSNVTTTWRAASISGGSIRLTMTAPDAGDGTARVVEVVEFRPRLW